MHTALLVALAPALLAQAATTTATTTAAPPPAPLADLAQLPATEAAAPRCAIAFGLIGQWQQAGEARGTAWPDMAATGGREFFVQAMAQLMDARRLDRAALLAMVARESERLQAAGDDTIAAMMPACLSLKAAAGL